MKKIDFLKKCCLCGKSTKAGSAKQPYLTAEASGDIPARRLLWWYDLVSHGKNVFER